ncbi:MAG: DUF1428 domain-containing protein [Gammaproteobacteria bacterium]|nr:DUF1428 domain-containing protein [Gammaproteobacteria bacterium]
MSYVDGFICAVPMANKKKYMEHAKISAEAFKDHGALKIVENWGDDVPDGELTSFPLAVKCQDNEVIVFSWVVWPSKEARNKGWQGLMEDERMAPENNAMPFDGKRLIYGGFETMLES